MDGVQAVVFLGVPDNEDNVTVSSDLSCIATYFRILRLGGSCSLRVISNTVTRKPPSPTTDTLPSFQAHS